MAVDGAVPLFTYLECGVTYYSRYQAGDCKVVWNELIQLGDHMSPHMQSDATSVCREIIDRTVKNLTTLHSKLVNLEYKFANPAIALVLRDSQNAAKSTHLEHTLDKAPLILRAWYERVHSVDFSQEQLQLYGERTSASNQASVAGLGCNTSLIFFDLQSSLKLRSSLIENEKEPEQIERLQRFLPTGGWASNCDAKGFSLPSNSVDGTLYNEGFGDVAFVEELRMSFNAGGFPFWKHLLQSRRRSYPVPVVPDFVRLWPVLTEGLLEI